MAEPITLSKDDRIDAEPLALRADAESRNERKDWHHIWTQDTGQVEFFVRFPNGHVASVATVDVSPAPGQTVMVAARISGTEYLEDKEFGG